MLCGAENVLLLLSLIMGTENMPACYRLLGRSGRHVAVILMCVLLSWKQFELVTLVGASI